MRKLLLPISLLLFLSSCDEQKTNIYNIVNDSSYPVTIVNYKDSARDTISLQKNEGTYSLSPSRYGRHSTPPPLYDFFHINTRFMQFQRVKSLSTQSVDKLLITVWMNRKSNTLTNDFFSLPIFCALVLQ